MALECFVLASNTAPVREVVQHGRNGMLLDFFDHQGLSEALIQACSTPERFVGMRRVARETILQRFDRRAHSAPAWRDLIGSFLGSTPRYRNLARRVVQNSTEEPAAKALTRVASICSSPARPNSQRTTGGLTMMRPEGVTVVSPRARASCD